MYIEHKLKLIYMSLWDVDIHIWDFYSRLSHGELVDFYMYYRCTGTTRVLNDIHRTLTIIVVILI